MHSEPWSVVEPGGGRTFMHETGWQRSPGLSSQLWWWTLGLLRDLVDLVAGCGLDMTLGKHIEKDVEKPWKATKSHDFPRKIVYKWLMFHDFHWFSTSLVCPGVLDGVLQKLHSIIIGWQGFVRYQTSSNSSKRSQTCKNTLNLISRIFVNCFCCFFSFHKSQTWLFT